MNALRASNLALRFVLELGALAALAYWGATIASARAVRIVLAIVLPVIMAVVWGLFISPKARIPTGVAGRAGLGLIMFRVATAALWRRGYPMLAGTYGSLAVASSILIVVWPQPTLGVGR
jgi:hypothetical protein